MGFTTKQNNPQIAPEVILLVAYTLLLGLAAGVVLCIYGLANLVGVF